MGSTKAPVFPDPVVAQAQISRPASATGIAPCWIGVGEFHPLLPSARKIFLSKSNSANVSCGLSLSGRDHSSKKSSSPVFFF